MKVINPVRLSEGDIADGYITGKASGSINHDAVINALDPSEDVHNLSYDEPSVNFYRATTPEEDQAVRHNLNSLEALHKKADERGKPFSWYGAGGLKNLWTPIKTFLWDQPREEGFEEWATAFIAMCHAYEDDSMRPDGPGALHYVDALYPSMYLHYAHWEDDDERERLWVDANMSLIMLVSRITGKKVYPFVWGQFHDSYRPIPERRFIARLEQMKGYNIDGFAHWDWGGRVQRWDSRVARDRRILEEITAS